MEELVKAVNHNSEELHHLADEWQEARTLLKSMMKQNLAKLLKETWMDGQDICQALHIKMESLRYLRSSRELPFTKLHNKYLYKYSDIGAILKKNYSKNKLPIKK